MRYLNYQVVFKEVPDEVTLSINITNCPYRCPGCHSPYLADDIGEPLDLQHLTDLIDSNRGISCVCIMGGDANPSEVDDIAQDIKEYYPELKVGWYSGRDYISKDINLENFNYIKYGHYDKDKGPLNSKTTNQVMLEIDVIQGKIFTKDITAKFWNVSY